MQVIFLSMSDLSVVKQFSMPPPMHFKEEGGASLSPDGTKFIAVCTLSSDVVIDISRYSPTSDLKFHVLHFISNICYRVDLTCGSENSMLNQEKCCRFLRVIMDQSVVCVIIPLENTEQVEVRMALYGYGVLTGNRFLQPHSVEYCNPTGHFMQDHITSQICI